MKRIIISITALVIMLANICVAASASDELILPDEINKGKELKSKLFTVLEMSENYFMQYPIEGVSAYITEEQNTELEEYLKSACEAGLYRGVDISKYNVTIEQVKEIYIKLAYLYPELMIHTGMKYSETSKDSGIAKTVAPIYIFDSQMNSMFGITDEEADDAITDEEYNRRIELVLNKTEELKNEMQTGINNYMSIIENRKDSPIEALLYIHDKMCEDVTYNDAAVEDSSLYEAFHAYGAFVKNSAVCQGYSQAMYILASELGIGADYCRSDMANHVWNRVKIEDNWYNIDVTHDDWEDAFEIDSVHENFLASDDKIIAEGENGDGSDWTGFSENKINCTDKEYESKYVFNAIYPTKTVYENGEYKTTGAAKFAITEDLIEEFIFNSYSPALKTLGLSITDTIDYQGKENILVFYNGEEVGEYKTKIRSAIFQNDKFTGITEYNVVNLSEQNRMIKIEQPVPLNGNEIKMLFWDENTIKPYAYPIIIK